MKHVFSCSWVTLAQAPLIRREARGERTSGVHAHSTLVSITGNRMLNNERNARDVLRQARKHCRHRGGMQPASG